MNENVLPFTLHCGRTHTSGLFEPSWADLVYTASSPHISRAALPFRVRLSNHFQAILPLPFATIICNV